MKNIVFLGGGYANVKAILSLARREKNLKIILVDKEEYHVLLPSVPAAISNPSTPILISYFYLFKDLKNFEFVKGEVTDIDFSSNIVSLKSGKAIKYDELVIGLGAEPTDFGVKGVREKAILFWNHKDLENYIGKIREFINKGKSPKIVIVGSGPIGVEVASETYELLTKKDMKPDVTVLEAKEILMPSIPELSKHVEKYLNKIGVKVVKNCKICNVEDGYVESDKSEKIDYDILVWSAGVRGKNIVEGLSKKFSLKIVNGNRISVDKYTRVIGLDNVWAVGDISFPEGQKIPPYQLAQIAIQEGEVCGENIYRKLHNKPLKELKLSFKGIVIQLNLRKATALMTMPIKIAIPPSRLGIILRKLIDKNYLISIGLKKPVAYKF